MSHSQKTLLLVVALFSLLLLAPCEEIKHRVRRKVLFSKNSKLFFRFNVKVTILPWGILLAHAYAVRVNYELPDTIQKFYRFWKRNVHEEIETENNIQPGYVHGYSCIFSMLCGFVDSVQSSRSCGMFCEMGKIIASSSGLDAEFFKSIVSKCEYYQTKCRMTNTPIIGM
ncbi:PREDICTED: uncharacterized protein LOC108560244 [Nicrophorus vespilloides]|uniref:Uncharacterized protein LOC108560244 n=1 Tax=Nicrophorus vespilloides TaxID=110193 RepID=A0ABM1MF43_NICVS|nr:PREDICTED: uncharacterized protein LOC108560244 [Nicrophorus vespilloides]